MRGPEDDDIEPCAIGSRAPPAYQKRTKRDKVKEKRDEQSVDRNRIEKGKDVERAAMSAKWEKKQTVQSATQREQEEREKRRHKTGP
ncbi:unnamed protein product [Sphagnum jensenii]|uniref:Small EDRK-rich factor-like N-terminal domain-containing protein n=2 Tax=Sphagnum jensenii TaxID=128206 RepID=A0ABP0VBJ5_9BRYO